jgi:hypothetical protein
MFEPESVVLVDIGFVVKERERRTVTGPVADPKRYKNVGTPASWFLERFDAMDHEAPAKSLEGLARD